MRNVILIMPMAILLTAAAKPPKTRTGNNVGVAGFVDGTTTFEIGGKSYKLELGTPLYEGDVVNTGEGRVKLMLNDDTVINLGPGTKFMVEKLSLKNGERKVTLKVMAGKFLASVSKWFGSANDFTIETPAAVAGIRGTVLWGDTQIDAICALYGTIEVKSKTGGDATNVKLDAGKCATKMGLGKTDPLSPTAEQVKAYMGDVMPRLKN